MNKLVIVAVLTVAGFVSAAPQIGNTKPIPILKQSFKGPNPDGSYSYSYETANGIQAQEEGYLANVGAEKEAAMQVQGAYSYNAPDGTPIQISYIANENGFQPQGAHLPTTPPVPPEILMPLEYIAAHPEENNIDSQKEYFDGPNPDSSFIYESMSTQDEAQEKDDLSNVGDEKITTMQGQGYSSKVPDTTPIQIFYTYYEVDSTPNPDVYMNYLKTYLGIEDD